MRFHRDALSSLIWPCLILAVLLAVPGGAQAGTEATDPAVEGPEVVREDVPPGAAHDSGVEESLAALADETAEAAERASIATGREPAPELVPVNPCYQFDDPSRGCYYKWRPSDLCCINSRPWCPNICY